MKYISKLLALFAIVMMATACSPSVTSVSGSSAIVTATATGSHIIHRGVCYSTSPNPTISNDKVYSASKEMVLTIGGLAKSTTYYVRGFAQTSYDVVYSNEVSFTTTSSESADDDPQTEGPSALKRVSVHDPSVVWDDVLGGIYRSLGYCYQQECR